MTKTCILIPSHINYENQIDLLNECINSLITQTIAVNIYASVSFKNETYKKEFSEKILLKYGKSVKFLFSKDQLFQMEHLYKLWFFIIDKKYDMIMFCDDDDTYNITRVKTFINAFECEKNMKEFISGVTEIVESNNPECEMPEYWCYGVIPDVLLDFFSHFNGVNYNLLKHKFGDMYLRHYLRKNKKHIHWIGLNIYDKKNRLYYYNINNPNSICGTLNNTDDQMLLQILDCVDYNEFNSLIKTIDKKYIEVFKYIYKFCKLLYEK
jgi:hypothetical protein